MFCSAPFRVSARRGRTGGGGTGGVEGVLERRNDDTPSPLITNGLGRG